MPDKNTEPSTPPPQENPKPLPKPPEPSPMTLPDSFKEGDRPRRPQADQVQKAIKIKRR